MKRLAFIGKSREDISRFPDDARRKAGYQLNLVQQGLLPEDWKPMPTVGLGVREIRIRAASGVWRVIYVANIGDAVFVLHTFHKKTQKTAPLDIELARTRYKQLAKELGK